jgi:hypothetical protein
MTVLYHPRMARRNKPKIVVTWDRRAPRRRDAHSAIPGSSGTAQYDDPALPFFVTLRIVVRQRPEVHELFLQTRSLTDPPIGTDELRSVPISRIVREVLEDAAVPIEDLGDGHFRLLDDPPGQSWGGTRVGPGRGRAMPTEHLAVVAETYRSAVQAGRRDPVNAVAEQMHASRSTAGRWVQQARAAGHLGAALGTKAGEVTQTKPTRRSKR